MFITSCDGHAAAATTSQAVAQPLESVSVMVSIHHKNSDWGRPSPHNFGLPCDL